MDPTERFTTRAEQYARYRPDYPPGALELLKLRCGLKAGTRVADLGSGTGILTRRLLEEGAEVFAVEPNAAMREAAEEALSGRPGFHSVTGTAEQTTLPAASVELLVAAQAFHWFDVAAARQEALRIVRAGGWGALLWNERVRGSDAFMDAYEALLRRHAPEYDAITGSRADPEAMRRFLGGRMEEASFPNAQWLDFESLHGRLQSASYAPEPGTPQYAPLRGALRELFEQHAQKGRVRYPYETRIYFAQLKPPSAA